MQHDISDDIIFEIELAKQIEVNIDYILNLIKEHHEKNTLDKVAVAAIMKAVDSSMQLRSKKLLIEAFLNTINADSEIDDDWKKFVDQKKEEDLKQIISEENLKEESTRNFINNCLNDGQLRISGTAIDDLMPPVRRFGGARAKKKATIIEKLQDFFEKYFGV